MTLFKFGVQIDIRLIFSSFSSSSEELKRQNVIRICVCGVCCHFHEMVHGSAHCDCHSPNYRVL